MNAIDKAWGCELAHLGKCSGPIEAGHIVNRSQTRNVTGAEKYIQANKEVLLAHICHAHNTGRVHDEKRHRAYLLQRRVEIFGFEYVNAVVEGLRRLFKQPPAGLRLEALLSHDRTEEEA